MNVEHVEGSINPIRDLDIIHNELRLKDASTLKTMFETQSKDLKKMNENKLEDYNILERLHKLVCIDVQDVRKGDWQSKDIEYINSLQLLTAKPLVYLCNISTLEYFQQNNPWIPKIERWIQQHTPESTLITYSGEFETELADLNGEERQTLISDYQKEYECKNITIGSALNEIIKKGYSSIHLIHCMIIFNFKFYYIDFTTGTDEVRAWTLREGSKAPQAAGIIHSDFEKVNQI